ncbi:hypothetical protein ACTWQL_08790 [Pseudalkalibacillus sp. R45]|uniref:hypothetical protein n=1 Tax=Pseudalkalibacillus sp. R45 TaxID=3457433 RepID=UPI003FCE4AFA
MEREYKWSEMSNRERNLLISTTVLNLECFSTIEGRKWYDKHYQLGNWHYTSNLHDAIDLSKRVIQENLEMVIIYSNQKYHCIISHKNDNNLPYLGKAVSKSLSESICLAVLQYKKINIKV